MKDILIYAILTAVCALSVCGCWWLNSTLEAKGVLDQWQFRLIQGIVWGFGFLNCAAVGLNLFLFLKACCKAYCNSLKDEQGYMN